MANLTPEQYRELYRKLPPDVREVYSSVDITETMQTIGKKHGIHIDDQGELVDETGLVLLGVTHPKDYIRNIAVRLEIDAALAKAIAGDINEQIFKPVRESLKKMHGVVEGVEVASPALAPLIRPAIPPAPVAIRKEVPPSPVVPPAPQKIVPVYQQPATVSTPTPPEPKPAQASISTPVAPVAKTPPQPVPVMEAPLIMPKSMGKTLGTAQPPAPPSFSDALKSRIERTTQPVSVIPKDVSAEKSSPAPITPPPATTPPPPDMVIQKLSGLIRSPIQETAYTPATPSLDPYREPIE